MSDESVIKHFEQETKLKMSQAIRLGAKMRPQCHGMLYDGIGTCALGAMFEGAFGIPPQKDTYFMPLELTDIYPELRGPVSQDERCRPDLSATKATLAHEIAARNDIGGCTREEIATWLESKKL